MTSTDNMVNAVIFVLSLNLIILFVSWGIVDTGGTSPFNYKDNLLKTFNEGNETNIVVPSDPGSLLPSGAGGGVDPDTGFSITDIFTSMKNWIVDTLHLGWILSILQAPYILLMAMFPSYPAIAGIITALWYGITLFIIVSFMWGR